MSVAKGPARVWQALQITGSALPLQWLGKGGSYRQEKWKKFQGRGNVNLKGEPFPSHRGGAHPVICRARLMPSPLTLAGLLACLPWRDHQLSCSCVFFSFFLSDSSAHSDIIIMRHTVIGVLQLRMCSCCCEPNHLHASSDISPMVSAACTYVRMDKIAVWGIEPGLCHVSMDPWEEFLLPSGIASCKWGRRGRGSCVCSGNEVWILLCFVQGHTPSMLLVCWLCWCC